MEGDAFVAAIALRLGLGQPSLVNVTRCGCGAIIQNTSGSHYTSCALRGWVMLEHDRVRDVLVDMLRTISPSALIRVPDRDPLNTWWTRYSPDVRPDILVLDFYGRGQHLILDVSIDRHLSPSHVAGSSRTPLHTAAARERSKLHIYRGVSEVHRVIPFIIESSGALGCMASAFLTHCAKLRRGALAQEAEFATWSARTFSPFWRQRLSIIQHTTIGSGIYIRAAEDAHLSG